LKTWGIFYGDRDAQIGNQFKSTMEECLKTCGYEGHEPNMVQVKPGAQASAWIKELKAKLNEGV
jgi:hypothetical protein